MKPLSRLAAWFYDYPDFNVTEQEVALLLAVKDGTVRKSDLGPKLRASGGGTLAYDIVGKTTEISRWSKAAIKAAKRCGAGSR
jgi:hypothetical protein